MDTLEPLVNWFVASGGSIDRSAIGFREFENCGRGAVALHDLPEGRTLFTIPRSLLLSTKTSALRESLGEDAWESLGSGWASLILCMMWELQKGSGSRWAGYLDCLPTHFSTPMFWSDDDLKELSGTSIIKKIGKSDAEENYRQNVVPLLQSRPDLFATEHHATIYSVESFHRLGSAILSRSFHVEDWKSSTDEMDDSFDEDDDDSEEEREDTGDVTMVPIADMLNARFEHDNARLFYEETSVSMITTKPIQTGDQIWNTYGDPPNSDLLRRYGHVDYVPLGDGTMGNPADVVEIDADLAVNICARSTQRNAEELHLRIDWWLEEGGDDVFVAEASDLSIPEGLISLVRLLMLSDEDFQNAVLKSKPPKPKLDARTASAIRDVLDRRLTLYLSQNDDVLLPQISSLPPNSRNSLIVRVGEKRILSKLRTLADGLATTLEVATTGSNVSDKKQKRPRDRAEGEDRSNEKRAKR